MVGYTLTIFILLYFAAAFVAPSYRVWKRTGINPVTFRGSDSAHDYIGRIFKVLMLGLSLVVILYTFATDYYPVLLPIAWLERRSIQIFGIVSLLLSLGWTILAQYQMGNSWRIGIDEEKQTELVQTGVFRRSRNPIFLGMIVTLTGVFLTIPNAFTLLFLVVGYVVIQIQVRLEETFLRSQHGSNYTDYAQRVRRWL